jgi:hypothetical protein
MFRSQSRILNSRRPPQNPAQIDRNSKYKHRSRTKPPPTNQNFSHKSANSPKQQTEPKKSPDRLLTFADSKAELGHGGVVLVNLEKLVALSSFLAVVVFPSSRTVMLCAVCVRAVRVYKGGCG